MKKPRTEPSWEELRALSDMATSGPWEAVNRLHPDREHLGAIFVVGEDGAHIADPRTAEDAVFIVAAVNAIRAALGETDDE